MHSKRRSAAREHAWAPTRGHARREPRPDFWKSAKRSNDHRAFVPRLRELKIQPFNPRPAPRKRGRVRASSSAVSPRFHARIPPPPSPSRLVGNFRFLPLSFFFPSSFSVSFSADDWRSGMRERASDNADIPFFGRGCAFSH